MWLEEMDLAGTNHLIMVFIGLVALAMLMMAIALLVVTLAAAKAITGCAKSADELKEKVLPLIDVATEIGKSSQALLHDATPKVKLIVGEPGGDQQERAVSGAAVRNDVCDANLRTQRQVARVDGMVTAALTATIEVVETVANGLRVPAQKIAAMAGQAKLVADGSAGEDSGRGTRGAKPVVGSCRVKPAGAAKLPKMGVWLNRPRCNERNPMGSVQAPGARAPSPGARPTIGFVSLGCPKNLVDSEVMMGLLDRAGGELTARAEDAEILVVNTCSFIDSAKQESVNTILEMVQHKVANGGKAQRLIVAGCLVERYRDEIRRNIPEVDAVVGTGELEAILEAAGLSAPVAAAAVEFSVQHSGEPGAERGASAFASDGGWSAA